jgi:hypothetical protein
MSQQVAEQLVYKLVQSFTLPTKLDTCVRIATCPHEVGDLTGEFLAYPLAAGWTATADWGRI